MVAVPRVGTAPAVDADPCTCGSPRAQHERRPSWSRTTTVPGTTRNHRVRRTPRPAQPRRGVRRLRAAAASAPCVGRRQAGQRRQAAAGQGGQRQRHRVGRLRVDGPGRGAGRTARGRRVGRCRRPPSARGGSLAERDAAVGPPRPAAARDASRLDPPAPAAAVPAGWTSTTSGDGRRVPPPASVVLAGPPGRSWSASGDAPKAAAATAPPTTTGAATRVARCERRWRGRRRDLLMLVPPGDVGRRQRSRQSRRFAPIYRTRLTATGWSRPGWDVPGARGARGGPCWQRPCWPAGSACRWARSRTRVGPDGGCGGGADGAAAPVAPPDLLPRLRGAARCRPGRGLDHDEVRGLRGAALVRRGRAGSLVQAAHDEDGDQRGGAGRRRHRERGSEAPGSAVPGAAHVGPPGRSGRDGRPL